MKYSEALALTKRGRDKRSKRMPGRNGSTWLNNRGVYVALTLHGTDVVKLYPDGSVSLHTGGWNTLTTRQRINEYNPAPGYAYTTCDTALYVVGDKSYELKGLKITANGEVIGKEVDVAELQRARRRELYQQAKRDKAYRLLAEAPHLKTELGRALDNVPKSKVEAALSNSSMGFLNSK